MNCNRCANPCRARDSRLLSQSADFRASMAAGKLTPEYKAALTAAGVAHEDVKAAARLYAAPAVKP